jgi:hypothetical protein
MKTLVQNKGGVANELARSLYTQPVLVPASPWLSNKAPPQPAIMATTIGGSLSISWLPTGSQKVWLWALQWKDGRDWHTEILPGAQRTLRLTARTATPQIIAVRAVDRYGNLSSSAAVLRSGK